MLRSRFGEDFGRPTLKDFSWAFDATASTIHDGPDILIVSQDGPLEVFDVMCSRTDVAVNLFDSGSNRFVANLTGPWLKPDRFRQHEDLTELIKVAYDVVASRDQRACDLLEEIMGVLGRNGVLASTLVFAPNSAVVVSVEPKTDEARADKNIEVWARGVQWVNL